MAGYSGLDFKSVADEITYWLAHTSQFFKGGANGSGENGNDFAMPTGTPVYAVTGGTVVGAGYYGGGGVVSVQYKPGFVWYYQHLDLNEATPGQVINPGQLIGYSGGQNEGGNHPSTSEFSGYPHIEVGIDAPWGGIWGGGNNVVNGTPQSIDPRPYLAQILATGGGLAGLGTTTAGITDGTLPGGIDFNLGGGLPSLFQLSGANILDVWKAIWGKILQQFPWIPQAPWDAFKIGLGMLIFALTVIGFLLDFGLDAGLSYIGMTPSKIINAPIKDVATGRGSSSGTASQPAANKS